MKTKIKKAIICKNVKEYTINRLFNRSYQPKAGDVAIFRVLEIGKHKAIQGESGKNSYLFPGDFIMAAFGTRYASNQFEGYLPEGYQDEYHILGMGGVIGTVASMHAKMEKLGVTKLKLFGYATNANKAGINTRYLVNERVKFKAARPRKPRLLLSVGASMDSGKTTSAAYLCRGLSRAGNRVAYIKLTGTVFSKDKHFVRDCGADMVADFSLFGYPSTYMIGQDELLDLYEGLMQHVGSIDPDFVVMEIADGLLQRETDMLLRSEAFVAQIDDVMLSCGDSLSVLSGLSYLNERGLPPFCISGLINVSPLLVAEVKRAVTVPLLGLEQLCNKSVMRHLDKAQIKIA